MNYRTFITTAFAGAAFLAATVWAQEANDVNVAEQQSAQGAVEAYDTDAGVTTTMEGQSKRPSAVVAQKDGATTFISAKEVVEGILDEDDLQTDGDLGIIVEVGTAQEKMANPATLSAEDFSTIRNMVYLRAYLNAKAQIIRGIDTKFEAFDRASLMTKTPETPEQQEFKAKTKELEAKREKLAEMLATLDEKEAEALQKATIKDKFGNMLDALTKKLDSSFDAGKIAAEKKAEYEAFKAECDKAKTEFEALREEAEKLPKTPKNETSSDIKMLAKMPLVGAAIYCQSESWNPSKQSYQVSLACVWSPKLQEQAEKTMTTGSFDAGMKGDISGKEWFKAQDLRAMIGSRRIVDDKGRILYIGIGASLEPEDPDDMEAAEMYAETDAIHSIAMALLGDLETFREVHQSSKTYQDGSKDVSRSLANTTTQNIEANLSGCVSLGSKTVRSPIAGKRMIVKAMYLDPGLAKSAVELMKKNYAAAMAMDRASKYKQGVHDGMDEAYEASKKDPTAYNQGKNAGKKTVEAAVATKPPVEAAVQGIVNESEGSGSDAGTAAPKGGSFSGDSKKSRKNFGL